MTLSLLKSSHITAGYASFDTDQYHGTGMPVSFSNYLTLTSPMGENSKLCIEPPNCGDEYLRGSVQNMKVDLGYYNHFT